MLREHLSQFESKKGVNPSLQAQILENIVSTTAPKKSPFYWPGIALASGLALALLLSFNPQEKLAPLSEAAVLLNHWNDVMNGTAFGPGKAVHLKSKYQDKDGGGETTIDFELWTDGQHSASRTEESDDTNTWYTATLLVPHEDGSFDSYEYNAPSDSTDCRESIQDLCDYLVFFVPAPLEDETLGNSFSFDLSIPDDVLECLEQKACTEPVSGTRHVSTIKSSIREDALEGEPMTVVTVTKQRPMPSGDVSTEIEEYWFDEQEMPVQIVQLEKSSDEEAMNYSIQTLEVNEIDESSAPFLFEDWEEEFLGINAELSPQRE